MNETAANKDFSKVAKAIRVYFKSNDISFNDAAARLGTTRQVVYNQLSRPFGPKVALKYATVFGFNETFLQTGKRRLVKRGGGYQKILQENEQLKALVRILKNQIKEIQAKQS